MPECSVVRGETVQHGLKYLPGQLVQLIRSYAESDARLLSAQFAVCGQYDYLQLFFGGLRRGEGIDKVEGIRVGLGHVVPPDTGTSPSQVICMSTKGNYVVRRQSNI